MHLPEVARPRLLHVSLLCFVACGGAEEQEPAVQLVEAADTLISTADGFLGNPVDVAVASDGRVWIADPQNHRLAVWNPADGSVDTVGREGDGPGELQDPVALAVAGGSILAMQPQAGRLTEFSASGEYVASRIVPAGLMVPLYL